MGVKLVCKETVCNRTCVTVQSPQLQAETMRIALAMGFLPLPNTFHGKPGGCADLPNRYKLVPDKEKKYAEGKG